MSNLFPTLVLLVLALCLSCSAESNDVDTDTPTDDTDEENSTDAIEKQETDVMTDIRDVDADLWATRTDREISELMVEDTESCAGKNSGDPCTTALFTAPICSAWGSLFKTEGICAEEDEQRFCDVESIRCAIDDALLTCGMDEQKGDVVMIARSACEYRKNEEARCVRRSSEIALVCNDQVGDHICHDATEQNDSNILYEITAMKCIDEGYYPECIPEDAKPVADCTENDQYCVAETQDGSIETLPETVQISSDYNHSWFTIDIEESWSAACEDRPPCLDKSYGEACETGTPAYCDDNMLVQATGTCDTMELAMTYECFPTRVDCGDLQCVEGDDSASCQ